MGVTVTPKTDGAERYQAHLHTTGPDGRTLRRSKYLDLVCPQRIKTYDEAMGVAMQWADAEMRPKLSECLRGYAAKAVRSNAIRPSTAATYISRFANLVDGSDIAGMCPGEVTVSDLEDLRITLLEQGRAPEYIDAMEQALSSAYTWFVSRGICDGNPVRRLERMRLGQPQPRALTGEELAAIAGWVAAQEGSGSVWTRSVALGIRIALATGMRSGEVCALKAASIDRLSCALIVDASTCSIGGHAGRGPTKSGRVREVAVSKHLLDDIDSHLVHSSQALRVPASQLPVITATGAFVFGTQLSAAFSEVRDELGLSKEITFHKLRHTHATMLVKAGNPAKDVQQRLGHADVKTTLDFYYQTDIEAGRRMAAGSAEALGRYGL